MSYIKYGIEVGQIYTSADGSGHEVKVVDVTKYAHCDDVIIEDAQGDQRCIDAFKLAMVRYTIKC